MSRNNFFHIVILFPFFLLSQSHDFQNWNNLEVDYKIQDNLSIYFDNSIRLAEESYFFSRYSSDFSIKRRHNKKISYSVGYRYIFHRNIKNDVIEKKNRYYGDFQFKNNLSSLIKYSFRTRFQSQFDVGEPLDEKNKIRQKVKFVYDLDKYNIDLFLSIEGFYILNSHFDKMRYAYGATKSLSSDVKININCMIEQYLEDAPNDVLIFVFRTKLSIGIN